MEHQNSERLLAICLAKTTCLAKCCFMDDRGRATISYRMVAELEEGKDDPRFPGSDRRYAHMDPALLPLTESLKTTVERFMPLWIETIAPAVKSGKNVIIAAHGNSLRVSPIHFGKHEMFFCMRIVAPAVKSGKNVIIAAHGNNLKVSHLSSGKRRMLNLQSRDCPSA